MDRVFTNVLGDLLRAKKFQSQQGRRSAKYVLEWHDPVATPFPPDAARSTEVGQGAGAIRLRRGAARSPGLRPGFHPADTPKQLVDARQHGFVAGVRQTAKQQQQPIQVTYTGVVPIVYKAQRTLLHSLIDSIGWAFVMIAAVMMILLRTKRTQMLNVRGGMVSMIPNVFPVILVFGAIGHMSRWNVVVDIGTMMTASVAMGVAVDDTIHFLTWFRRGIREGLERHDAIRNAYCACGRGHDANHSHRRPGTVRVRAQHVHAHTAVRHHDADTAGRRTGRRPDHSAGLVGRPAGQVPVPSERAAAGRKKKGPAPGQPEPRQRVG